MTAEGRLRTEQIPARSVERATNDLRGVNLDEARAAGIDTETLWVRGLIDAAGDRYQPYHYRTARGDEVDLVHPGTGGDPYQANGVTVTDALSLVTRLRTYGRP